ncbi:MAG TPA: DUF2723 domain-containing protein [Bacteroidales bacterium]|nr:DUF2723 domain-containing protein [Bacteroidales bacterium]
MKLTIRNLLPSAFVFLTSLITYALSLEPSVSWWDCGEFIAAANGLEVGHPPGAPLFLLIARFFTLFATGAAQVALMVNLMSALASALTVLFLYWTIKIFAEKGHVGMGPILAGLVGSLTYAFTDTFWFSAVEGEVYALSSLFTAVVFWAILRWEREYEKPGSMRWILLIAFLMGLSIGVHLLNLLAIPAIVLIWYFKKNAKPEWKGISKAFGGSLLLLAFVMYGLIPGVVMLASWFELFFINLIGLPFGSGLIVFVLLLVGSLVFGLRETRRRGSVRWNHLLLALALVLTGYSSYTVILIRASADPPMNQSRPDNVFSLLSYLNREQYGDRPLLYGPWYNAPRVDQKAGKPIYGRVDGKYKVVDRSWKPVYDKKFNTFFPRMWQGSPEHAQIYKEWGGKGRPVQTTGPDGKPATINKPTFSDNLRFFFNYQLGHMYFRYFMWNFAGRQNDTETQGGIRNGNWISGIGFIDSWRLGPQDQITDEAREHKSRNKYYLLPLLLGLGGGIWQYRRNQKDFWVVFSLFVFTGIAIVVYLNQYPNQPRERDYSYAASFYAFAIWIGLGVQGIREIRGIRGIRAWGHGGTGLPVAGYRLPVRLAAFLPWMTLIVPIWVLIQNFDDHDRSGRYIARDFAYNYLNSCAPNAILFTNGDNDTFPLWYAQEVEGVRRDVRVICLPYLATDWYIDQMKKRAYESAPVPFSLSRDKYAPGKRDYIVVYERMKDTVDLREIVNFVASDDPGAKLPLQDGTVLDYVPTRKLKLPVNRDRVLATGTVPASDAGLIVPEMFWELTRSSLYKSDLMILDLIATNNWERPIYFTSINHENIMGLQAYFRLEGFAYRLVPIRNEDESGYSATINTDILYDRLMNTFRWGNIEKPGVFIDYNTYRTTLILRLRQRFALLADQLLSEGKRDSALLVLDRVCRILPPEKFRNDVNTPGLAEIYYKAGVADKGNSLMMDYVEDIRQDLAYIMSIEEKFGALQENESQRDLAILSELLRLAEAYEQQVVTGRINDVIRELQILKK